MGEDISTGAKIGITLIILCALIAIVFALLTMMKNLTNQGSTQMQSGLDNMLTSQFQDYDQKVLTGTQLMSSLAIFDGQPICIVVRTTLTDNIDGGKGLSYGVRIMTGTGGTYGNQTKLDSSDSMKAKTAAGDVYLLADKLVKPTGKSYYEAAQDVNAGVFNWNVNTKPMAAKGTPPYIRGSAKFLAELIKDPTEEIIGICFTQQK